MELKTGKADLKQRKLLLQLVSLSQISNNRKGVVVLGTDCAERWRLVFFLKYNEITVQPFTRGKIWLQEFTYTTAEHECGEWENYCFSGEHARGIREETDMDLTGEGTIEENYVRGAKLRKLAFDLGKLYPDERESFGVDWTRGKAPPPLMIYM